MFTRKTLKGVNGHVVVLYAYVRRIVKGWVHMYESTFYQKKQKMHTLSKAKRLK